jgi:hypothetical protein
MPDRVRFDGVSRRFYEAWYTIFNDPASGDGFWIRYTLLNPLDDHPEAGAGLWFAYTCRHDPGRSFAIRKRFAPGSFEAIPGSTGLRIGDSVLEEGLFRGAFDSDGRSVEWDLRYQPSPMFHEYLPGSLRRLAERRNAVTLPNPKIRLSGTVRIDGTGRELEACPGHSAHHWGIRHPPRWNWGHCCAFERDDAILELLSGQGPGGIAVTFVLLHTREGSIECNRWASLPFNSCVAGLGFWRFVGHRGSTRIVADIRVDPRHVQKFDYLSPDYRRSECWNTQVGDCLVRVYEGRDRLVQVLRARGTAAAEIHDERPEGIPYRLWSDPQRASHGNTRAPTTIAT